MMVAKEEVAMMVGSTWDGSDNGEESGHGSDGGK